MLEYNSENFTERGRKDLLMSEDSFKNTSDFELAAYLAQQALEKFLKAYLLKAGLISNPKELGHIQIIALLSKLKDQIKNEKRNKPNTDAFVKLIDQNLSLEGNLADFFDQLRRDQDKKVYWWKFSLNMTIDGIENDEDYKKFIDTMSNGGARVKKSFNTYVDTKLTPNMQKINQISPELASNAQQLSNTYSSSADDLSKKSLSTSNQNLKNEIFNLFQQLKNLIESGKLPQISKDDLKKQYVLADILINFLSIIMRLFPHEELGRYPALIDGKSSTKIYEERKEYLWDLIQEVKDDCNEIEKRIMTV